MVKNKALSDETSLKRLMTSDPNLGPNVVDREEEEGVSPSIELKFSTPLSSFLANHITDSKSTTQSKSYFWYCRRSQLANDNFKILVFWLLAVSWKT